MRSTLECSHCVSELFAAFFCRNSVARHPGRSASRASLLRLKLTSAVSATRKYAMAESSIPFFAGAGPSLSRDPVPLKGEEDDLAEVREEGDVDRSFRWRDSLRRLFTHSTPS